MNDGSRASHRLGRGGPPAGRTAVAIIAAAALTVLAVACGGSKAPAATAGSTSAGQSSSPSGSASNDPLAFSRCMRSHGIPTFPDPGGSGAIPKQTPQQLGISTSRYQTALTACTHLLPSSGGPSHAEIQRMMSGMQSFARCMRSHGVSNWPDPTTDRAGYPVFYLQRRIDASTPQIVTEIHACQHRLPQSGSLSIPGGVAICPGDRPGPGATSSCGGPNQGG